MPTWFRRTSRAGLCSALVLLSVPIPTFAQIESQGHGQLTIAVGQASAPFGNIATGYADSTTSVPTTTAHSIAWRIMGGYQFSDYLGAEAGISYADRFTSNAPYLANDEVTSTTTISIVEAAFVARIPLATWVRIDLTGGAAVTACDSSFGTKLGNNLPLGQSNPVHVRKFGAAAGVDLEWRMSEVWSLIVGDHFYPGVGSSSTIGAGHGTLSILSGGVHIQF